MPRRLPVLLERSIAETQTLQTDLSHKFDQQVKADAAATKTTVTCFKGCSSCCYHPVNISIFEGILIHRWLVRHHKWTPALQKKLKETADRQYGTTYEVWLLSLIPCPLLDKQTCTAYEARPFNCRVYYAVSDPHYCHPHRLGSDTRIVPRGDVLDEFHRKLERILRSHRLQVLTMPIGSAILRGAQICEGSVDLVSLDRLLFEEFVSKA
jgi:Fe-S-cluster containining protein